ncbi:MAG: hypothetical protein EHM70_02050, partial [Chloroflexota bacterium]
MEWSRSRGANRKPLPVFIQRLLVSLILLPFGLAAIALGGVIYAAVITLILALAAWEYIHLLRAGGYKPAGVLVLAGVVLLVVGRGVSGFESGPVMLSLLVLASMTYHLVAYECGRNESATDFALTLAGPLYLGWIGAYLISLRQLPEGEWWLLVALPSVWLADSGAYLIGK